MCIRVLGVKLVLECEVIQQFPPTAQPVGFGLERVWTILEVDPDALRAFLLPGEHAEYLIREYISFENIAVPDVCI